MAFHFQKTASGGHTRHAGPSLALVRQHGNEVQALNNRIHSMQLSNLRNTYQNQLATVKTHAKTVVNGVKEQNGIGTLVVAAGGGLVDRLGQSYLDGVDSSHMLGNSMVKSWGLPALEAFGFYWGMKHNSPIVRNASAGALVARIVAWITNHMGALKASVPTTKDGKTVKGADGIDGTFHDRHPNADRVLKNIHQRRTGEGDVGAADDVNLGELGSYSFEQLAGVISEATEGAISHSEARDHIETGAFPLLALIPGIMAAMAARNNKDAIHGVMAGYELGARMNKQDKARQEATKAYKKLVKKFGEPPQVQALRNQVRDLRAQNSARSNQIDIQSQDQGSSAEADPELVQIEQS